MSGFILLARDIQDKSIWTEDPALLKFWVWILLNANYRKDKVFTYDGITVRYGEVLKSYRKIGEENEYVSNNKIVQWSTSRIARMLKVLEDSGRITFQATRLGTHIHVLNYEKYQGFDHYKAKVLGTANGQGEDKHATISNSVIEVKELWAVYLEELGGSGKQPTLTAKRKQVLEALYEEQLKSEDDYTEVFRGILKAVKSSDHHMGERAYQMPESLFRNDTRRSTWAMKGSEKGHQPQSHGVGREWSIDA